MRAALPWFLCSAVFGIAAVYFHPNEQPVPQVVVPAPANVPPTSAALRYSQQQPQEVKVAPPPVVEPIKAAILSRVGRVSNQEFHVVLAHAQDWFDTGIPVTVDQDVDTMQTNPAFNLKSPVDHFRYAIQFNDREMFSSDANVIYGADRISQLNFSTRVNFKMLFNSAETLKMRLLSSEPLAYILVKVGATRDSSSPCRDLGLMNQASCNGYSSGIQEASSKASSMISQIPLE
jgi:hypothetical protein